ncbi:MAG: response regulator [Bacteroidota bacterium]|nr:response regulator [Bacteroidota bacterium]
MKTDEVKTKILIVDDVKANIIKMKDALTEIDTYIIIGANSGKSGIAKAKAQKFDLILLDIVMPDIDGFEVCSELMAYAPTKNVPIIFLTSKNDADSIIRGFRSGAVDYILKPFSKEELQARVKVHVQLKKTQEELIKAKEMAVVAAKAKSLFLANMSHEIRTPMNGIMGMIDMFYQTKLTDQQKEYLEIIDVSSENLLCIINDILDFSKIEAGQIEFESIKFSVFDEVDEVLKVLSFKAKEKNLSLQYDISNKIPKVLIGDPVRLKQILINLINNALKFTSKGGIQVFVELLEIDNENIKLKFRVVDTGIGISDEGKARLFKSFSQTDASVTRKFGGTGLGLAISKNLAKMMNGEIGVDSEEGKGATFWFTAEFKSSTQKEVIEEAKKSVESGNKQEALSILVAEDNVINQRVARFNLERFGHTVQIAENGIEAIEKYKETHFDLVFMDIQMPEMDGIEATKEIRRIENEKGVDVEIPIIAMTANTMKGDRENFLNAGLNDYIGKPFKADQLFNLLERIIKQTKK